MKKFNYTGRQKIERSDIGIQTFIEDGQIRFNIFELELDNYELPDDAEIVLEAYRRTSMMSFGLGTVGNPVFVPGSNHLELFHDPDEIRFRLKIVEAGDSALLLARADELSARSPDMDNDGEGVSLLPIISEDIGEEVWKLDFEDGPRLLINSSFRKEEVGTSEIFRSIVMPQAMQQILSHLFFVDQSPYNVDYPDDSWQQLWYAFAMQLAEDVPPPVPGSDNFEESMSWISDVVATFARQHQCRSIYENMKER